MSRQDVFEMPFEKVYQCLVQKAEREGRTKKMRQLDKLSSDLKAIIPTAKCFSPTNLRYMKRFYELVFEISEMLPQDGAESGLSSESIPALISSEKLPQVGAELLSIPWGHIKLLIDKRKSEPQKVLFYSRKTIENNWSRAVFQNWLDTDLYERQGKATRDLKR